MCIRDSKKTELRIAERDAGAALHSPQAKGFRQRALGGGVVARQQQLPAKVVAATLLLAQTEIHPAELEQQQSAIVWRGPGPEASQAGFGGMPRLPHVAHLQI